MRWLRKHRTQWPLRTLNRCQLRNRRTFLLHQRTYMSLGYKRCMRSHLQCTQLRRSNPRSQHRNLRSQHSPGTRQKPYCRQTCQLHILRTQQIRASPCTSQYRRPHTCHLCVCACVSNFFMARSLPTIAYNPTSSTLTHLREASCQPLCRTLHSLHNIHS